MGGMADFGKSLRVPSRLCSGPTDLGIAFPHGGTDLGLVAGIAFRPNLLSRDVTAEEFGGERVEVILAGERPVLAVVLRGFTDTMVNVVFRETATGASSGDKIIRYTSTTVAGQKGSGRAIKLLISPRDTTNHPGLLLYRAIPLFEETAELRIAIDEELGYPIVFRCIRDGTARTYEEAKLEDMTL